VSVASNKILKNPFRGLNFHYAVKRKGEKHIGVESTGVALGYSAGFFFQRTKRESKALKTLRDMVFSGKQI